MTVSGSPARMRRGCTGPQGGTDAKPARS